MEIDTCSQCKNYIGGFTCSAFPDGIPAVILNGEDSHSSPLKGQDNNIIFEQIPADGSINIPVPEEEENA